MEHPEQKWPLYSTSSSSESSDTKSFATIELESRDEVNPVAKEESRGDEEVFEAFDERDDQGGISIRRSDGPTTGVVISSPTAGVVQFMLNRIDEPATGTLSSAPPPGSTISCSTEEAGSTAESSSPTGL